MLLKPTKWARASAIGLACLSLGVVAVAAQVTPPAANAKAAEKAVTLSPGMLNRFVGHYRISDLSAIAITRSDDHLVLRVAGQVAFKGPYDLYPRNNHEFFIPAMNATVDFLDNVDGTPRALLGTVNGHVAVRAGRIGDEAASQIDKALAKRIADQQPFPGSEKALQLLLNDPDGSTGISANLAEVRKEQKEGREKYLANLGPVTSYKFEGVTDFGWDSYRVDRRNGAETVYLLLDDKGVIVMASRRPVSG